VKLVVGEALMLTLSGVALGLAGALALTRLMASYLFGVSPIDPITFALTSIAMIAVAFIAGYLPAQRATRVDPVTVLRVG
jgi:putative ABC transport system permease protein